MDPENLRCVRARLVIRVGRALAVATVGGPRLRGRKGRSLAQRRKGAKERETKDDLDEELHYLRFLCLFAASREISYSAFGTCSSITPRTTELATLISLTRFTPEL